MYSSDPKGQLDHIVITLEKQGIGVKVTADP